MKTLIRKSSLNTIHMMHILMSNGWLKSKQINLDWKDSNAFDIWDAVAEAVGGGELLNRAENKWNSHPNKHGATKKSKEKQNRNSEMIYDCTADMIRSI